MREYSMRSFWEKRLRQHFDLTGAGHAGLGPRYNAQLYKARLQALERGLINNGRTLKGARVLEVGCGTGFYTEYCLRQEVRTYVGVDITSISVETLGKQYPNFRFIQADITEEIAETVGGDYDVVLAADVLFHIVNDNAFERAIQNLCFALSSDGLLIIADVFPACTTQVAPHVRLRSLDEFTCLLNENHTRIVHIEPIFAILQPPPFIPCTSWSWKGYASLWRAVQRLQLTRLRVVDRLLPPTLGWLDKWLFCPLLGHQAPNNKWLLAIKS